MVKREKKKMRLINADKLIKLIKNDKIDSKSIKIMKIAVCEAQVQTLNMACDRHIKMIKEQPTYVGCERWIPVTEGPPKNDDWVAVTILDESGDTPFRYTDFGWYLEAARCWIVNAEQRTDVIAWMPSPKPWEGERE